MIILKNSFSIFFRNIEDSSIIKILNNKGEIIIRSMGKKDTPEKLIFCDRRIPWNTNSGRYVKQEAINHLNNSLRNRTERSPPTSPVIRAYNFLNAASFIYVTKLRKNLFLCKNRMLIT